MSLFKMTRRALAVAALSFALVGCGQADGPQTTAGQTSAPGKFLSGPAMLGDADAPLVMIEYASVTCIHCKHFHEDVMPTLKADYIAAGLLRFEYHDFPTPPADLAVAGFAIARCAGGNEAYFAVLDDLFANQTGLIRAMQSGQALPAVTALAERHGMDKAAVEACLQDEDLLRDITAIVAAGEERGIRSTPTIFLDGVELTTPESRTAEGMRAILDARLAELGIEK